MHIVWWNNWQMNINYTLNKLFICVVKVSTHICGCVHLFFLNGHTMNSTCNNIACSVRLQLTMQSQSAWPDSSIFHFNQYIPFRYFELRHAYALQHNCPPGHLQTRKFTFISGVRLLVKCAFSLSSWLFWTILNIIFMLQPIIIFNFFDGIKV